MDVCYLSKVLQQSFESFDVWSEEAMAVWVPTAVYWVQCSLFEVIMMLEIPFIEKYRIYTEEERGRNKVSFGKVIVMVTLQHIIQIILGILLMKNMDIDAHQQHQKKIGQYTAIISNYLCPYSHKDNCVYISNTIAICIQSYIIPVIQFVVAMLFVDTYQYVLHRMAHTYTFVYKYMHSHHHRLYAPYAFGALYNHPLEALLLDTLGAAIAFELTGMSPRLGMCFFVFSTVKTVNDHCGYAFPWDPLSILFKNNVKYHSLHHQPHGIKTNYSQPFFTFWDTLLNTEYSQVMKAKAEEKARKHS
ncbi:fatty acid hydroxylase superfamily-domain-containing protein [Pilobolus umbonatus]|nr:fatty acid hydroxylase superfamily-domain-containing protein [Pilobolus umbonatus]